MRKICETLGKSHEKGGGGGTTKRFSRQVNWDPKQKEVSECSQHVLGAKRCKDLLVRLEEKVMDTNGNRQWIFQNLAVKGIFNEFKRTEIAWKRRK